VSDDKYPRVLYSDLARGWFADHDGTLKIVPADAIVIERGDVKLDDRGTSIRASARGPFDGTVVFRDGAEDPLVHAEARAREFAAIAEYLRADPPVDEEQVQRLTKVLCDAEMDHPDGPTPHVIARRLYLAGVRAPEVTP